MKLRCLECDGPIIGAVQQGSYLLRCPQCRITSLVTSWCVAGPAITREVAFYREGAEDAGPVLTGVPAEMWQRASELTSDGSILLLHARA
jgi:hypothetical protein